MGFTIGVLPGRIMDSENDREQQKQDRDDEAHSNGRS